MNKSERKTVIKKVIFVLLPIMVFVVVYQYVSITKSYNKESKKTRGTIERTIYLTEKNYRTIEQVFNNRLEAIMQIFEKEYEKHENPKDIDLYGLKKSIGGDVDFYIINSNGIIVYSTDLKDIGLNFSNFSEFYLRLNQIRNDSSFAVDDIESETLSGNLRKYAYKGTNDKKYTLELSISPKTIEKYLKYLNYEMVIADLKKLSSSILDIKIYELNGDIKSVNGIIKANKEKQELINRIFKENIVYTKKQKKITTKMFMTNFQDKSIRNKIIEITYDISYLKSELIKRIITIFVAVLISVVFMIRFLNIFFGTKIKNSIDKMLWLLALLVFLDLRFIEKESKFINVLTSSLLLILPFILYILYKEIKKQYGYLERYLTYDKITKLPTRYNLKKDINHLLLSKRNFILITINIKNLTDILNVVGYNDYLFKRISNFIMNSNKNIKIFNSYTTNYEVLIEEDDKFNLDNYIKNLINYINDNVLEVNGNYFQLSIAIGIFCSSAFSSNKENAIKFSYEALDYASRKNKEYQIYSLEVKKYVDVIYLASKLEECIENNEFFIEYQPKYNIIEEKVFSCEALVRWQNKEFGLIPPGEFIPYLEKTNKITILTKWVISQVLKDIKEFDKNINLSVSINVCPIDLNSKGFVNFIFNELDKHDINSHSLELEITEGDLIKEIENSKKILSELREIGIRIAIDDFGTGYSSLSYLNTLPVDQIKIDKSFTDTLLKEADKKSLLKHVITLCHELKKEVVIEGVEDIETVELLKEIRCEKIQGYYISKPISKESLMKFCKTKL